MLGLVFAIICSGQGPMGGICECAGLFRGMRGAKNPGNGSLPGCGNGAREILSGFEWFEIGGPGLEVLVGGRIPDSYDAVV